jgi:hypothetical protein
VVACPHCSLSRKAATLPSVKQQLPGNSLKGQSLLCHELVKNLILCSPKQPSALSDPFAQLTPPKVKTWKRPSGGVTEHPLCPLSGRSEMAKV